MFITAAILIISIIIIIIIRKKKSTRLSLQTARFTVAPHPQASVVQSTYPSVHSQSSTHNPSYCNPTYAQPQVSTGEEATLSGVSPSAGCYPFHHDTEHAAVGSTSNPSALPDDDEVNPPPYYVEHAPDGSTNEQSTSHDGIITLPPPDYASVVSADYVEHAADGCANQSTSHDGTLTLSSPDYASVVSGGVSVPVPSVNNI